MRACCLSSLDDEIAIWFATGEDERVRFTRAPCGGEALRLDMAARAIRSNVTLQRLGRESRGSQDREYLRVLRGRGWWMR